MKKDEQIEIRDNREAGHFWADNEIIDQYFHLIGPFGFSVYMLFCRWTKKGNPHCDPSIPQIAKKLNISEGAAKKAIKSLVDNKLISVTRRKENIDGKPVNSSSVYTILAVKGKAATEAKTTAKVDQDITHPLDHEKTQSGSPKDPPPGSRKDPPPGSPGDRILKTDPEQKTDQEKEGERDLDPNDHISGQPAEKTPPPPAAFADLSDPEKSDASEPPAEKISCRKCSVIADLDSRGLPDPEFWRLEGNRWKHRCSKYQPLKQPPKNIAPIQPIRSEPEETRGPGAELYFEVYGFPPSDDHAILTLNAAVIGKDPEQVKEILREWSLSGFNKKNIKGIVDVILNGWRERPHQNGNGKASRAPRSSIGPPIETLHANGDKLKAEDEKIIPATKEEIAAMRRKSR